MRGITLPRRRPHKFLRSDGAMEAAITFCLAMVCFAVGKWLLWPYIKMAIWYVAFAYFYTYRLGE